MDREKLKVASQPHVHDLKFEEGQPLSFELHVEIRPEIELARTAGIPRHAPAGRRHATTASASRSSRCATRRPPGRRSRTSRARATWCACSSRTADESGEFPEPREYPLVLGSGQAIPGVEELIMELKPGETAERSVRWPDDFPDEAQRGKTKPVRVHLLDVKRKSLPALDDAFAREVGDFESLDALNSTVRKDLEEHAAREADAGVRQQLVDQIAAANPFDVPPSWVNQLIDGYLQAYQVPEEERDRFRTEFRPVAERQVRRDLIIETIAERETLKATEADIDDRVAEVASKRGADPGQVYASLQKAGRLREIEQSITEDKVFEWLLERNEVG